MTGSDRTDDHDRPDRPVEDHRRLRESMGAWVLGALDGPARREVEAHVASCSDCAVEVAVLSPLPGLLNRVSAEEVVDGRLTVAPGLRDRMATDLAAVETSVHRRLARWRATAVGALALATVAALIAGAGLLVDRAASEPAPDRLVAPIRAQVLDAVSTRGEAAALAWEWGTTVELDLQALPDRATYVLWAVATDGRREQAGTWGATSGRGARVRGASSIARADLDRVEVTDADGTVLMTFTFLQD